MRSSFYNSEEWNEILIENMGEEMLFETARDPKSPKVMHDFYLKMILSGFPPVLEIPEMSMKFVEKV